MKSITGFGNIGVLKTLIFADANADAGDSPIALPESWFRRANNGYKSVIKRHNWSDLNYVCKDQTDKDAQQAPK